MLSDVTPEQTTHVSDVTPKQVTHFSDVTPQQTAHASDVKLEQTTPKCDVTLEQTPHVSDIPEPSEPTTLMSDDVTPHSTTCMRVLRHYLSSRCTVHLQRNRKSIGR